MMKKLIVVFVIGFVIVTVIVAIRDARRPKQWRIISPPKQTQKTLNLDTTPPQFPAGNR
jgi:hypothetical protein